MSETSWTSTSGYSTADMPTLAEMKQLMDEHRKQFPPGEMLVELKANKATIEQITEHVDQSQRSPLDGVKVTEFGWLPDNFVAMRFLDDSVRVANLKSGFVFDLGHLGPRGLYQRSELRFNK